ncbi:MAG: hypothetical protein K5905_11985 [Roseibium sp.]|uniref:hypothetical protein n=1 Tax=Roseibium sp. TaxID=1936156 RepID=UPI00263536EA|nr:hypothetical protein [Roseibium sp.]MCV0426186.1 hypothetical protein [Roseibium sp.]
MNDQIDPSVLEKWFTLVGRWQDVEADLQQALDQLGPDDPERNVLSANAKSEFAEIKQEMDALIASAKPNRQSSFQTFVAGSIDISKSKL